MVDPINLAAANLVDMVFKEDELSAEDILEGDPRMETAEIWRNEDASIVFGVTRISSPCKLRGCLPETEYLYVVRGSMTIDADDSARITVSEGEALTIPSWLSYECTIHEPFEDIYVLLASK